MLLTAAVAVVLAVLYFGVLRPVQTYRNSAVSYLGSVLEVHNIVQASADELRRRSQGPTSRVPNDGRPSRIIASEQARQFGLALIRIQPQENGATSFWFSDVNSRDLFSWIVALQRDHGLKVERAEIQKATGIDAVTAQVVLRDL